jgi:hypothetical protein
VATTNLAEENRLLREQVNQLIADNLALAARLEYNYDPNKPTRKLTLQEILELNMGNSLNKYRIPAKIIKNIYCEIVRSEREPVFIDISFDNDRMFSAFYFVDIEKEKQEQEKGESIIIDPGSIPDDMPQLQQKYDIQNVLEQIITGDGSQNNDGKSN